MTIQAIIGVAAGLLSFAAYPIYIVDILRGNTKPNRATWWVLALSNAVITASYFFAGARDTIWIPVSYTIGFSVVALLSLKYGEGKWGKSDLLCVLGAVISLGAWWVFQSAEIALYLIILTDFLGLAPTIYKAYKRPWTESKLSWTVGTLAGILNIGAIDKWTLAISLYPIYVAVTSAIILFFILFGKKEHDDASHQVSLNHKGIPTFPEFKKLELSDKEEIESHAEKFEPYSDFEFGSLWSWDVQENMEISWLNHNLVIRFNDYVTGEPFYTFLGSNDQTKTAITLIEFSEAKGLVPSLQLVPEESIVSMDPSVLKIEESREHFDYLYEIEQHVTYSGGKLKSRRNFLNGFLNDHPNYGVMPLDLCDEHTKNEVLALCRRWEENKGYPIPNEVQAHARFLNACHEFEYSAIGITIDGVLVAFCTTVLLPEGRANALFEKVDIKYRGIHALLRHEVAKDLKSKGYTHLNYEQDLGIESLRQSKMAFNPSGFLKKYRVSRA